MPYTNSYVLCTVDLTRRPNNNTRQFWDAIERRWTDDPKSATVIHDIGLARRLTGDNRELMAPPIYVIRIGDLPTSIQRDVLSL